MPNVPNAIREESIEDLDVPLTAFLECGSPLPRGGINSWCVSSLIVVQQQQTYGGKNSLL